MKRKLYLTAMLFMLAILGMSAQPKQPIEIAPNRSEPLLKIICEKDCDEALYHPRDWGYNFLDQDGNLFQYYGGDPNNSITLSKGIYDILAWYQYNQKDFQHFCYVIHEHVALSSDTTIRINPKEATFRIQFEPRLPNGETAFPGITLVHEDYSREVIEEGNIGSCDFAISIALKDGTQLYGQANYWDVPILKGKQVRDRTHMSDFFINHVSDRFLFCCNMNFGPKGFNGNDFYMIDFTASETTDTTITNNPDDFIIYEKLFKQTPFGKKQNIGLHPAVDFNIYDNQGNFLCGNQINIDNGYTLQENEPVRMYLCYSQTLESPWHCFITPKVADAYSPWSSDYFLYNYDKPIIFFNGKLTHINAGFTEYTNSPNNTDNGMNVASALDWNDVFSYDIDKSKTISGNSCPILIPSVYGYYLEDGSIQKSLNFNRYLGRNGECCESNQFALETEVHVDEVLVENNNLGSEYNWVKTNESNGVVDLRIINNNVDVDGISGYNLTKIHFAMDGEDTTAPTLQMLDFRDTDNNIIDRFSSPIEANIMFCGGDFNEKYINNEWHEQYYDCQALDQLEVTYSPYHDNNWQPLEVLEVPELFHKGMGYHYTASLASVSTPSENGWFDLKFRLVDESGNWQEQTLSPAFRIDNLVQSAVTEVRDNDAHELARYSIDGKRVDDSHHGIVIVKMSDGTARKVLVP